MKIKKTGTKIKKAMAKYSELKNTILEQLDESGIDIDMLTVTIQKGPKILIDGEVCSHKEYDLIQQIVSEISSNEDTEIEDIENNLTVMEGIYDDFSDNEHYDSSDLYNDPMGTEDVYESIEDGVPYIPPDDPSERIDSSNISWRKKKKKTS